MSACKSRFLRSTYNNANQLIHETENLLEKPFLKAHFKNGDVYILEDTWQLDTIQNLVLGEGSHFNHNRKLIAKGMLSLPLDSVALFETNERIPNAEGSKIVALSIFTGVNAAVGIYCISVPKACFGSCPTFYMNPEDNFHYSDAEGFSNAILPSLEYGDIDALHAQEIVDNRFSITMKNEALETHMVNNVKILAYPVQGEERVFHTTKDEFFLCENTYLPSLAMADEGEITALLSHADYQERFSLSDENNISSKEEIFLTFDQVKDVNDLGFILHFRQSMMTTYFIYSAMGYMGDEVGDIFAKMETEKNINDKMKHGFRKELGDVDVYLWNEKNQDWVFQDGFYETGPIAVNKQIIPLENLASNEEVKIKIVLNRGLWRLDYAALTNLKDQVEPMELKPSLVLNKGVEDVGALRNVLSDTEYIISMPGDEYQFDFDFPVADNNRYDLFLYSKGYYLEWMRDHWLKDKNLWKLRQLIENPKAFFKAEAKEYKKYEEEIEHTFWNSKIDTKNFSYHEE